MAVTPDLLEDSQTGSEPTKPEVQLDKVTRAYMTACVEIGRASNLSYAFHIVAGFNDFVDRLNWQQVDKSESDPRQVEALKLEKCLESLSHIQNSTVSLDTIKRSSLSPDMANALKALLDLSAERGMLTETFFTNPDLLRQAIGEPLKISEVESGVRALRVSSKESDEQTKLFDVFFNELTAAMRLVPNEVRGAWINRIALLVIVGILMTTGSLILETVDDLPMTGLSTLSVVTLTALISMVAERKQQEHLSEREKIRNQELQIIGKKLFPKPVSQD